MENLKNLDHLPPCDSLNEEDFSVDLDSLNRMNILLDEKERNNYTNFNNVNNNSKFSMSNITPGVNKSPNLSLNLNLKDSNNFNNSNNFNSGNVNININASNNSVKPLSLLNLAQIPRNDFNDEFMENYNDFSPSWRKEVEKINLSKF